MMAYRFMDYSSILTLLQDGATQLSQTPKRQICPYLYGDSLPQIFQTLGKLGGKSCNAFRGIVDESDIEARTPSEICSSAASPWAAEPCN